MPERRDPPAAAGPLVPLLLEEVRKGATPTAAAKAVGIRPSIIFEWLRIAEENPAVLKSRRPSKKTMEACRHFAIALAEAKKERDEIRVEEALRAITVAASEGHTGTRIVKEVIPATVETTVRNGPGGSTTTTKNIPAHVREVTEVTRDRPDWRAGVALIEKLAPERFSPRSDVRVRTDLVLREGEAELVAAACTDEERRAIDRGDVAVLARVVARVRSSA